MRKILATSMVLGFLAILGPATARADNVLTFFDNTETLQFVFGNDTPVACTLETCGFSVIFVGVTFASPIDTKFNIYDQDGVTLSDTLEIFVGAGLNVELFTTFVSDAEGGPALTPLPGGTKIIEDGTVQTAATIPLNGPFAGGNFVVQFQSDVDAVSAPEPSSLLQLGTGLLGLMGMGLYKNRLA